MASGAEARGYFGAKTADNSEEDKNTWIYLSTTDNSSGTEIARGVFTHDDNGHGAYFFCTDENITVRLMIEPGDFRDMIREGTSRFRKRKATLTYSDGKEDTAWGYYMPQHKTMYIKDRGVVARVFKSASKAEKIGIAVSYRDPVDVQFPARNGEFSKFVKNCRFTSRR